MTVRGSLIWGTLFVLGLAAFVALRGREADQEHEEELVEMNAINHLERVR